MGPRRASVFHVVPVIWHRPPPGCIKINTDGAARGRTGKASCGGVFRDCTGSILGAFSESCGHLTAIEAELQGVIRAVDIAWRGGLRRIWLECDSTQVVKLVNKLSLDVPSSVRDMWIITLGFLKQMEFYTVTHIYREGNAVADRLANYAFESASAFQFWGWNEPPEFVLKEAKIDASGLTRYRVK